MNARERTLSPASLDKIRPVMVPQPVWARCVPIEAMQVTEATADVVRQWCGGARPAWSHKAAIYVSYQIANLGDWVLRTPEGHFHVCAPELFADLFQATGVCTHAGGEHDLIEPDDEEN